MADLSGAQRLAYNKPQAFKAVAVTPSDSADLSVVASGVYIGGDGNMRVTLSGMDAGTHVDFIGLKAGSFCQ
jgi:hypothetical protein